MKATPFERHLPFVDEGLILASDEKYIYVATDSVWGLEVPADSGYLVNDGPGTLEVRISDDGEHYTKVQTVRVRMVVWVLSLPGIVTGMVMPTALSFRSNTTKMVEAGRPLVPR